MIARTVVYDAGMLVALLRDSSAARLLQLDSAFDRLQLLLQAVARLQES